MRVLATTQPGSSVFFQMAPLLCALQAAGHEVCVATSKRFGSTVRGTGLPHEPAGLDWLESALGEAFPDVVQHVRDPHGALVRFVVDVFARRTAAPFAADALALIERWRPALLLHAVAEFGGAAAAEAAGVPHLMVMAGIDNWLDRFGPALAGVDEGRRAVGLAGAGGDRRWLFEHGLVLAEVPGWSTRAIEEAPPTWLRPTSPSQPTEDMDWLDRLPRPRVHVTLGTVFNKTAKPLFGLLARAAAGVAASVVVTIGRDLDAGSLGDLPPNVHVRGYLPLGQLLERCDAVVAHGGWGTLVACAEAGVPMAALTLGADQGYNARILERAGAGFGVEPSACTPEAASAWTRRLLGDSALREGAKRMPAALREVPSPADVAESLSARFG